MNAIKYLSVLVCLSLGYAAAAPNAAVRYKPFEFNKQEMVDALKQYDEEMYGPLPDRIDCEIQSYLENCEHINLMLKKHPDAPMRIPASNGSEVVLQADTPTSMTDFILSPGAESASKTLEWWRGQLERLRSVESVMFNQIFEEGGISPNKERKTTSDSMKEIISSGSEVRIVLVVESTCPSCKYQLGTMASLKQQYPGIEMKVFQLDSDVAAFKRNVLDIGLVGQVLTPEQRAQMNIKGWPYTRVINKDNEYVDDFYGSKPLVSMVQTIAYVAKKKVEENNEGGSE